MLKYFGLKEILFGLKRFAALIVAIAIVFGALGFILTGDRDIVSDSSEMYYSSRSYLIIAKLNGPEQSQSESDIALANTVSAMLTADFAKQYVMEKLLETYTIEDIIKYSGAEVSKNNVDHTIFNDKIVSNVIANTTVVNFYVKSSSEEFAKTAVGCFENYLTEVVAKKISPLGSLELLGGTTVTEKNFNNESSPSPSKNAVIFAIVGFVLSICGVLLFVFIKPTIATKKNYEEYGLAVLDDSAEHSHADFAYASDAVMNCISKNNLSSIAAVSTINSKSFLKKFYAVTLKLQSLTEGKQAFAKAHDIISDFAQFEAVKGSDAVILVEEKGKTYHTDLANTVSLLAKYDIPVIGVILI